MGALGAMIGLAAMVGPPVSGIVASRSGIPTLYLGLSGIFALGALTAALVGWRSGTSRLGGSRGEHPGEDPAAVRRPASGDAATLAPLVADSRRSGLLHHWSGGAALVFAVSALSLLLPLALTPREGERAMLVAGRLLGVFS